MTATIQAVFENGVLRRLSPLDLDEGQTVEVLIADKETVAAEDAATILGEIAALPVEGGGDPWTSRDHDQVLYRRKAENG